MKITFDYEEDTIITEGEIEETKKKISLVEKTLHEKLPEYLELIERLSQNGNYIEIHFPIFEYGITFMISKLKEKFLISVLDQRNSKVYGNLLLDDYKCINVEELKKLGTWSSWRQGSLSVFKPDQ